MKYLNKKARKILDRLTEGLTGDSPHKKIDNGAFMPVIVEYLCESRLGRTFSVAHHYEQNGDPMRDPDMEFVRAKDGNYYPIYYRQDGLGIEQEVLIHDDQGEIIRYKPKLMSDLARFGNQWMKNIEEQQGLGSEEGFTEPATDAQPSGRRSGSLTS